MARGAALRAAGVGGPEPAFVKRYLRTEPQAVSALVPSLDRCPSMKLARAHARTRVSMVRCSGRVVDCRRGAGAPI